MNKGARAVPSEGAASADKMVEPHRSAAGPPRIHFTRLPESRPGDLFFDEWNLYRQEVGGWLADGQESRHVLIAGRQVIGVFDTWEEAQQEGLRRTLPKPFFIHEIREEEPYLRVRGLNFPWPGKLTR
jgi:hypothetical protein